MADKAEAPSRVQGRAPERQGRRLRLSCQDLAGFRPGPGSAPGSDQLSWIKAKPSFPERDKPQEEPRGRQKVQVTESRSLSWGRFSAKGRRGSQGQCVLVSGEGRIGGAGGAEGEGRSFQTVLRPSQHRPARSFGAHKLQGSQ